MTPSGATPQTVAMVTSSYPRYEGDGAGTFVRSLAEQIASDGHIVHVIAPAAGRAVSLDPGGIRVHEFAYAPFGRASILGYGKAMVADRRLRAASYALIGPYVATELARTTAVARRERATIIHGHWLLPNGPAAAFAARILRLPLVLSLHGTDVTLAESRGIYRRVARWVLRRADAIAACSADLASRAIKLGARREGTSVVPYGVDISLFTGREEEAGAVRESLGVAAGSPVVLGYGRLVAKKGFKYLVLAFGEVLRRFPEATLVIAGEGDLRADLESAAAGLGIADKVRFPGLVRWTDAPALLAAADVFVLPSIHDDTGNVDGLPNTLLEAMASALPIVATPVGGVPAAIAHGKTGLLAPEGDAAALAAEIVEILASSDRGARLGLAAREKVRCSFAWPDIARQVERMYESARGGASRR